MDVIDEGKSNRHVAVTSESLSYNIVIETQDVQWLHEYQDRNHFNCVTKTIQKNKILH